MLSLFLRTPVKSVWWRRSARLLAPPPTADFAQVWAMVAGACRTWSLLVLTGMWGAAPGALSAQRIVAWGDLNYDTILAPVSGGVATPAIAAGDFHSAALQPDGAVVAWGDDRFNQTNLPPLLAFAPAVQIAAGNVHNLVLMQDGSVLAWGPSPGQPGDYGQCDVPAGLGGVKTVAAGAVHSLALGADGTVTAWGLNANGQCSPPPGLGAVAALAGGMYHSLALKADGTLVAWGDDRQGQTDVPPGLSNVVAIAAGGNHNLALRSDGTVVSWGTYGLAQCGVPSGLSNVTAIATGDFHSLALGQDGTLVAWGFNTYGQCTVPPGLTNVSAIAARGNHSMVLIEEPSAPSLGTPPTLNICLSGGHVLLSWPASATGLGLQANPDLNPANWAPVTNLPVAVNGQNQVSLPVAGNLFFRLANQ